jgi:hypothetical protein
MFGAMENTTIPILYFRTTLSRSCSKHSTDAQNPPNSPPHPQKPTKIHGYGKNPRSSKRKSNLFPLLQSYTCTDLSHAESNHLPTISYRSPQSPTTSENFSHKFSLLGFIGCRKQAYLNVFRRILATSGKFKNESSLYLLCCSFDSVKTQVFGQKDKGKTRFFTHFLGDKRS